MCVLWLHTRFIYQNHTHTHTQTVNATKQQQEQEILREQILDEEMERISH